MLNNLSPKGILVYTGYPVEHGTPSQAMISPFEYIIILISIVLGMGITQILSGIAGLILRWEHVKTYWPHLIWILLVFTFHIQEWWVTYELRTYKFWRLPVFLFIILYPVNLYLLARIIFPLKWSGREIDMKLFYFQNCRKIFAFVFLLSVLSILNNLLIARASLVEQTAQFAVGIMAALMIIFDVRKAWIHQLLAVVLLLTTIVALAVQWDVLLIVNN